MANERIELVIQAKDQASPAISKVTAGVVGLNQALQLAVAAFQSAQATISKTVGSYSKFETTLSRIKVTSKATVNELKSVERAALNLGASTIFSANQVADGFLVLAKSGKTVEQQLKLIKPTLDLATAGAINLDEAASFLNATMGQFSLEAGEATRIADIFVASANSADQSVSQFAEALKEGGQTAKAAGFSLEETATLVSALADSGVKASQAGTAVRGFSIRLARLGQATGEQAKVLKNLGLEFNKINPQARSLTQVFEGLNQANLSLNDAVILFGEEAGPKFLEIINKGGPGLERIAAAMNDSASAADAANSSIGKLEATYRRFINLIESIFLGIGKLLAPLAELGLTLINEVLDPIDRLIKSWNGVAEAAKKAGNEMRKTTGYVSSSEIDISVPAAGRRTRPGIFDRALQQFRLGGTGLLQGIGRRAASQVAGVSGAVQGAQAAGPFGAAVGAGAELLLSNQKLQKALGKVSDVLIKLVDPIAEAISPALEALVPLLEELKPVFKLIGNLLRIHLQPLIAGIKLLTHWMRQIESIFRGLFKTNVEQFIAALFTGQMAATAAVQKFLELTITGTVSAIDSIKDFFSRIIGREIAGIDAINALFTQFIIGTIGPIKVFKDLFEATIAGSIKANNLMIDLFSMLVGGTAAPTVILASIFDRLIQTRISGKEAGLLIFDMMLGTPLQVTKAIQLMIDEMVSGTLKAKDFFESFFANISLSRISGMDVIALTFGVIVNSTVGAIQALETFYNEVIKGQINAAFVFSSLFSSLVIGTVGAFTLITNLLDQVVDVTNRFDLGSWVENAIKDLVDFGGAGGVGSGGGPSIVDLLAPGITIPTKAAGGAAEGLKDFIEGFHQGGLITQNDLFRMPGMAPNEGLIMAQSGERVLSRADGANGGSPVNITFNVRSINPESQKEEIRQMLEELALTGRLRVA